MTILRDIAGPGRRVIPHAGWWILLGLVLTLYFALGWIAAAAVLVLAIAQRARPLDFLTSYLLVVAGASFINYGRGALTSELGFLTIGILFMLFCYVLSRREEWLAFPQTIATRPLLVYFTLTVVNFVRGILIGNKPTYAGLELIAMLALFSSLLVGTRRLTRPEIMLGLVWLWIVGLAHSALGFYIFGIIHVRTGSIYFTPVPGVVSMLLLNFALRDPHPLRRWGWLLMMGPLLAHQFISFTRGYWLGIINATIVSILLYGGRAPGWRLRWGRSLGVLGGLAGIAFAGALVAGSFFGIGDIFEMAGSRFASTTGTEYTWETSSNVVRLVEYMKVLEHIQRSPWFGHGLGHHFVVREPIGFTLLEQWFTHQNFLLVTLKQGLLGLVIFLWVLVSIFRMAKKGVHLPDTWEASWCTGACAVLVYIVTFGLVHFPLAEVNATFASALIWGAAMGMTSTGNTVIRWNPKPGEDRA